MAEKIAIVVDTNILRKGDREEEKLDEFSIDLYDETLDLIERNELNELVNIFIPEIVLLELKTHKIKKLKSRIDNLFSCSKETENIEGIEINLSIKKKHAKEIIEKTFKDKLKNIYTIDLPKDKNSMNNQVFDMFVSRLPPFDNSDSDRGYKDCIILLSMIDFAKENNFDQFILFTDDNVFLKHKEKISEYFAKKSKKKLFIEKGKDIQGYVLKKFSLFSPFREFLNEEFFPDLIERTKEYEKIVLEKLGSVCEISSFDINHENTFLEEMEENKFIVNVGFRILCRDIQGRNIELNDVTKKFEFDVKNNLDNVNIKETGFNYPIY